MPPEVAERAESQTFEAIPVDIFALGVILFIFKFGAPPFKSATMGDINFRTLQVKPESFWRLNPNVKRYTQHIDSDFKDLLISMLAKDPSKRPKSIL